MVAMLWWPLILALPLPFTRAGPISSGTLTKYIADKAPSCSHSCILTFIQDNFPTQVCMPDNFNCLCINPTSTGYTIGEAIYTCIHSTCNGEELSAYDLYTICEKNEIPGRQSNTHTSLPTSFLSSALPDSTSTTTSNAGPSDSGSARSTSFSKASQTSFTSRNSRTTSSSSRSTSSSSSSSTSIPSSTTSTTTDTIVTPSSSVSAQANSTSTSVAANPATTSAATTELPAATKLSKSQIAGVVIASVGAAALAFGFCFFLVCYRRRRKNDKRRQSDASWGEKLPQSQDSSPEIDEPLPRNVGPPVATPPTNRPSLRVMTPSTQGWQNRGRNSNPYGIGLALAPDNGEDSRQQRGGLSPNTPYSQWTQSQLLPDRPHYATIPTKARDSLKQQSPALNARIPPYRPDKTSPMSGPVFPSAIDTSQANLQGVQRSMSDPFYNEPRSPPIDYRGVPHTPYTNPPTVRPPSMMRVEDGSSVMPRGTASVINPESNDIPPLPGAGLARLKSQKYPPRKKSASSSRYTRYSNGSATSFEDIDEEQTPLRSATTPIESYFKSPASEDEIPPLPVKSIKRDSHIINRPHPTRSQRRKKGTPQLALDTQSRDVTQTAKWKILVSPGLQSLEESLPTTPKTPKTPAMLGKTPPMPASDKLPRPTHTYRIDDFR